MMFSLLLVVAAVQPGLVARGVHGFAQSLPYMLLGAACCGVAVLMGADHLLRRFPRWLPLRAVAYIAADARTVFLNVSVAGKLIAISVAALTNMAITAWLIALALDLSLSLADCLVFVPVVVLASTMPVSIGGWGVREGAMVVLLATVGVSSANALALSVLFGLTGIVISLPGVAIWLAGGHKRLDLAQADLSTEEQSESPAR